MIWHHKDIDASKIAPLGFNTMSEHLGIEFLEVGDNFLTAKMPVDHRTKQPYGLLHGGASCVLAETLGSIASALVVDSSKFICVGLEINANHIRSVRDGFVTAIATPIHIGGTTHVWDIKIHDDQSKLVCISRLTVAILEKRSG